MATMQSRDTRTFVAGEDLSTAQFKFVTLESDGEVDLADSAGENCIGVLLVEGAATRAVTVVVSGSTMVEAGGTVTAGGAGRRAGGARPVGRGHARDRRDDDADSL